MQCEIYDPRNGKDYKITNSHYGVEFSSLDCGFFVLQLVGEVAWLQHAEILNRCIQQTSKSGFVTFARWLPQRLDVKSRLEAECDRLHEFGHTFCGYFPVSGDSVRRILELRAEAGEWDSGEWCIGGCLDDLTAPRRLSMFRSQHWGLPHVLGQSEKIGCVLALEEMLQTTLLTRMFDNFDRWLHDLVPSLSIGL